MDIENHPRPRLLLMNKKVKINNDQIGEIGEIVDVQWFSSGLYVLIKENDLVRWIPYSGIIINEVAIVEED